MSNPSPVQFSQMEQLQHEEEDEHVKVVEQLQHEEEDEHVKAGGEVNEVKMSSRNMKKTSMWKLMAKSMRLIPTMLKLMLRSRSPSKLKEKRGRGKKEQEEDEGQKEVDAEVESLFKRNKKKMKCRRKLRSRSLFKRYGEIGQFRRVLRRDLMMLSSSSVRFDDVDDELSVIQRDLTRITTSNCFLNLSSSSINPFRYYAVYQTPFWTSFAVCVIGDNDASSEPNWGIDHSTVVNVKELHIGPPILAAKSPFFYKLFSNGMRESEQRHVTLRISAQEEGVLMELLNFVYINSLSVTTAPALLDVLMAADKFEVVSCMRYCSRLLRNMPMTPDSALLYLELPSSVLMAEAVEPLTDAAKQFLASSFVTSF
ncbi:SKP1/BTB/POZ domain protein [Raphanus sativus]|nr:SKP1/BTB/POZ domain protein [Raphanus sativus]